MNWFLRNWDQVAVALGEHLVIAGSALAIGFAFSLAIGIAAARRQRVFAAAMAVSGILYTIPTLAFLALLIPIVGLGKTNAIVCMVAFSLMILVRNIATGIREVPAEVTDAARGMGMNASEILWRVELPLALPVIVAGLRIAAVTVISVTVVAAYVNAGGLGTIIFNGIASDHPSKIVTGAIAACLLAIAVDASLAALEAQAEGAPRSGLTGAFMLADAWRYILDHPDRFGDALWRHVTLSAAALAIAAAIAIPLGVWLAGHARLALATINAANVGRTLPSLAVLALTMPLLGTGFAPSLLALTLLALPPILINTHAAVVQVDADVIDAARGMGMTRREIRRRIVVPLAIPVIAAGVRIAAIQVISGAVLAAYIGGGGLGDFITAGIAMMELPLLLVGAVPATLLAIGTDFLFGRLQRSLTPRGLG